MRKTDTALRTFILVDSGCIENQPVGFCNRFIGDYSPFRAVGYTDTALQAFIGVYFISHADLLLDA